MEDGLVGNQIMRKQPINELSDGKSGIETAVTSDANVNGDHIHQEEKHTQNTSKHQHDCKYQSL